VYSQVVSATPPSIAIEALVLGGPERVRARRVFHSQQQQLRMNSAFLTSEQK